MRQGLSQPRISMVLISGEDNGQPVLPAVQPCKGNMYRMCIYLSVLPFMFSDSSPNVSGNRTSKAERDSSPALEDTGYDDIEELGPLIEAAELY